MPIKTLNKSVAAKATVLIVLFSAAGYFREYFFVQINNILYMKYYNTTSHLAVGSVMQPFQTLSYEVLYYSKYPFTILWTLIFFALNYFCIAAFNTDKTQNRKSIFYFYLVMISIGALSMTYGYFINGNWDKDEYTLSRWLFGIAQSPVPALFLLVAASLKHSRAD